MSDPRMIQALGGPAGSIDALKQQRARQMYANKRSQLADLMGQARGMPVGQQGQKMNPMVAQRLREMAMQGSGE